MSSQNLRDWDQPIPVTTKTSRSSMMTDESRVTYDKRRETNNLEALTKYIDAMTYLPVPSNKYAVSPLTETLAKPAKRSLIDNAMNYSACMEPIGRRDRLQRMANKHTTMAIEDLETILHNEKLLQHKAGQKMKSRKAEYYKMLGKLEKQCRAQYLEILYTKFSKFIAKLATTMRIPPTLTDPYARMQRGIFCNILIATGVQPESNTVLFYNTPQAREYEICHKLSHALLSLIIKALDSTATLRDKDVLTSKPHIEVDEYLKGRHLCDKDKKL